MVHGLNDEEVGTDSAVQTRQKRECRSMNNCTGDVRRVKFEGSQKKHIKFEAERPYRSKNKNNSKTIPEE